MTNTTNQTDSSATSGGGSGHDPQCYKRGGSCGCGGGCCGKYDRTPSPGVDLTDYSTPTVYSNRAAIAPQAVTPSPELGKQVLFEAARDYLNCVNENSDVAVEFANADAHTKYDRVRSRLQKALIQQAAPEAPTCTCPSGDGSLRWPCPQHPPEATPAPQAATPLPGGHDSPAHPALDFDKLAVLMAHYLAGNVPGDLYWRVDVTAEVLRRAVAVARSSLTLQAAPEAPTLPAEQVRKILTRHLGWLGVGKGENSWDGEVKAICADIAALVAAPVAPAAPQAASQQAGEDVEDWRVGEFWSSANPGKKVLMLARGIDIENFGWHKDFIRWVGYAPHAATTASASGEDPRITAFYKLRDIAERDGDPESASIIQQAAPDERRNIAEVQRTSDMGLSIRFLSARACSAFERYLAGSK